MLILLINWEDVSRLLAEVLARIGLGWAGQRCEGSGSCLLQGPWVAEDEGGGRRVAQGSCGENAQPPHPERFTPTASPCRDRVEWDRPHRTSSGQVPEKTPALVWQEQAERGLGAAVNLA